MKKKGYLYRSQLNIYLVYPFLLSTAIFIWRFYLLGIPVWLLLLIGVLFQYLLLAFFQCYYCFYDNCVVKMFLFRPFYRKKTLEYDQFYKIRIEHAWNPIFIVYQNKKQYFKCFNNFVFNKHAGRIQIIEFLLSKNVQMEVRTGSEKIDKEIIDLVKKKYPKNIHLYP